MDKPKHVAVIMDGNGRWAKQRHLPRALGHRSGLKAAKEVIELSAKQGVEILSLFALSSENLQGRPQEEINHILELFTTTLQRDIDRLHDNNIQLRFIGDHAVFGDKIQQQIKSAMMLTANNTGLKVIVALNYGGKWDIVQAAKHIADQAKQGELDPKDIDASMFASCLSLSDLPDPDLFIRTGGDNIRISNFFLWQLAYTELYFSPVFWPDFGAEEFNKALEFFSASARRFGQV